jgi:ABC-type multidrug transport system ATPase subunit
MKISLSRLGKKFNKAWLFRNIDLEMETGGSYALLGINGSGKSTLLQLIAGNISPSEGSIIYQNGNDPISSEEIYSHISLSAPYLELPEELTLNEIIDFHFRFKDVHPLLSAGSILEITGLKTSADKPLKLFSSGMRQRVKLCLAICSDTPLLLLDEPCTNLDAQGVEWYMEMIRKFGSNRITLVASNQQQEYSFCRERLNLADYKLR